MKKLFSIRKFAFIILVGVIIITMFVMWGSQPSTPEEWAEGKPKHHTKNGFRNYPVVPEPPPVGAAFYVRRTMDSFFLPDVSEDHYLSEEEAISQFQKFEGHNSVTWLGHATFLIRINGKTVLTDPFLTEYSSIFWIFGSRRYVQPGINLANLPPVDMLVVSHNHLDHLDAETVESLQGKDKIQVFVPLGLKEFFKQRGYSNIHELDWNESVSFDEIKLTALPTVHFSGREANDKNNTLWCSWSISSPTGKVFFSGDTSYSPTIFKTIGEEKGPYNIAIVTIGAYKTRKHGPVSHLTPEQAVKVAMETKSKIAVAMHWGTIELSDEPIWEPPVRFRKAAEDNGLSSAQAWIMKIGETRHFSDFTTSETKEAN